MTKDTLSDNDNNLVAALTNMVVSEHYRFVSSVLSHSTLNTTLNSKLTNGKFVFTAHTTD